MQLNDAKLSEFVRQTRQKVYAFFCVMQLEEEQVEELMVETFRDFASDKKNELSETRLFAIAWNNLAPYLKIESPQLSFGRDTRSLSSFDENLLATEFDSSKHALVLKRVKTVDPDFRVPVVLKDFLKFEDDEILKILKLRWSVYRHRLHRGRLEIKDALKGKSAPRFSLLNPEWAT